MRLLLVAPDAYTASVGQSLGLGYLATAARTVPGVEVEILSLTFGRQARERLDELLAGPGPDMVGISLFLNNFSNGLRLIETMRQAWPGVVVLIGGPQVSSLPRYCMRRTGADLGVVGEGETLMPPLLEALAGGDPWPALPGLLVREGDGARATAGDAPGRHAHGLPVGGSNGNGNSADGIRWDGSQALVSDLDGGGFPAWDLMLPEQITRRPRMYLYRAFPTVSIITTRGCPYPCEFCTTSHVHGKALRRRSAGNVVDEIEQLVGRYGVREITFEDDNLTLHRQHIVDICEEILRRDLRIWWKPGNGLRPDKLDRELLTLMKRSGCYQISLGTETGSEAVLESMQKKMSVDHSRRSIELARELGLEVVLLIMMGYEGETEEDLRQTLELTRAYDANLITVAIYTPLPGTRHFRELYPDDASMDRIDWEDLNFYRPRWSTPERRALVKRYQRQAMLGFYLRPRQLAFLARSLPWRSAPSYAKAFWRFVA